MELMTKYQYTYFIYPYVVDSKKYNKYILKLLKNKNCRLRVFEKEKDMHLYDYFLPNIREYMFWSFDLNKNGIKSFNELDTAMKATLLSKHNCNIFEYELTKDLQGKVGERNGIFFDINKIKIVCFKTGICYLIFKTILPDNHNFSDILNFNYKFREINSNAYNLKEYENIRIQSDVFKDVKEISTLIKEITGQNIQSKKINLDNEKFITYSYTCLDQYSWNDDSQNETLEKEFGKYKGILPESKQMVDDIKLDNSEICPNKYVRYGLSNTGTVLLTSDINLENYTTLAQKYESEFLYTYIIELYKNFLLKKINADFNKTQNFKNVEKEFLNFAKKLWIQEITNDDVGKELQKKWNDILCTEEVFSKLKSKYDLVHKRYKIEASEKKNKTLLFMIGAILVMNIVSIILLFLR